MNDITSHIKKATSDVMLSHDERAHLKHVVREYMAMKPLPQGGYSSVSIHWFSFSWIQRPLAAALALVFIFSSGISYAAESALPGDALYSVKTKVNEPVKVALASGAEAKANVQMEIAERRINEAATLASENRLDAETQDQLAASFETHAQSAADEVASIDENDSSAVAELTSRFETRLAAHQEVLAQVQGTSDDSDTLAIAIRDAGLAVADVRARAEARSSVSAPAIAGMALKASAPGMDTMSLKAAAPAPQPDTATSGLDDVNYDRKTAERMRVSAEAQLKIAQKKLKSAKLEDAERDMADAKLSEASDLIANGKVQLDDKAAAHAYHSFQDSLVISEKLSVMLDSSVALKKAGVKTGQPNDSQNAFNPRAKARGNAVSAGMQAATMNVTVPVSATAASAAEDIVNIIPPSLKIFQSQDDNEDDNGSSDEGGEGHGLIHIGL